MSPEADGSGNQNLYGSHPFVIYKTKEGFFSGIFFYNTNAQQFEIKHNDDGTAKVNWRSVGGIFDMYFFLGPKVEDVIR